MVPSWPWSLERAALGLVDLHLIQSATRLRTCAKIYIVPTQVDGTDYIFLYGATFVLQDHLETNLGYVFNANVNGLKGHLIPAEDFNKDNLLTVLNRYGFSHDDFTA